MNPRHVAALFVLALVCGALVSPSEAGHKIKLKKIAKMLLLANALTGKKILLPLPLPLPIPVFQENIKHIPYEVKGDDYGMMMGGYGGGGMMGGYGGGMMMGGYGGGGGGGFGGGGFGGMKGGGGGGGYGMGGGFGGGGGMKGGGGGGGGYW